MAQGRMPLSDWVPVITTARLTLRPVRLSDEKTLSAYWTSERSRPNDGPHDAEKAASIPYTEAVRWYHHGLGLWIAVDRGTGNRLVAAGLTPVRDEPDRAEMGWDVLSASAEGFGFATEAAGALLDHGRALGFADIRASMYADNTRSRRLAERLGGACVKTYSRKDRPAVTYRFGGAA